MHPRFQQVDYDPRAVYPARRHATIEGRVFERGEPVPRHLAKDASTYRLWWNTRLLDRHPYDGELPVEEAPAASAVSTEQKAANAAALAAALAAGGNIEVANGHHPAPPIEGRIEKQGRGWCLVTLRTRSEKVRGLDVAMDKLNTFRAECGLPALTVAEVESITTVAEKPAAEHSAGSGGVPNEPPSGGEEPSTPPPPGHVAKLQPGDEVVDGETGEIRTGADVLADAEQPEPPVDDDPLTAPWGEEPDDETPSNPFQG